MYSARSEQIKDFGSEYCSIDPDNPCVPYGLKENSRIKVWRHDHKTSAIFRIKYNNELPSSWLRIRITAEGRKRLGYNTKPTGKEKLKLQNLDYIPENHHQLKDQDNTRFLSIKNQKSAANIDVQDMNTSMNDSNIIHNVERQKFSMPKHSNEVAIDTALESLEDELQEDNKVGVSTLIENQGFRSTINNIATAAVATIWSSFFEGGNEENR